MYLMTDCEKCMEARTKTERQRNFGCGYEPALDGATGWDHPGRKKGDHDPPIETCIGYTRQLPEVIEVARAHHHWREGAGLASVKSFCGGEEPDERLVAGIEFYAGATSERDSWLMTPKDKGGGAE